MCEVLGEIPDEKMNEMMPIRKRDIVDIFGDTKQEEWTEILEHLKEHGPSQTLELIFDFYERYSPLDAWSNYLLACSHFTEEDLNICPTNRGTRRQLERRIAKLIKQRGKDPHTAMNQFLYNNRNLK